MTSLLRRGLTACLLALAAAAWAQTPAPPRYALVVGNNAYPNAPLVNPVNDAKAMADALQAAGFAVTLRLDIGQGEMVSAVREFGNLLRGGGAGTVGLFYFAGHGMQIKGRNYLVPVGANIEHEDEVAYQAMDAQAVLDKMESAGNGTNLVILDACRNNPFARAFRSASQGLAPMDAPVGTLVAFATAPGSVASDGTGTNGLYTTHLLEAMRRPGVKVEDVFKQVRSSVRRASQGRQVPMEWSSLEGDFYFTPGGAAAPPPATAPAAPLPDPQAAADDALWAALKDGTGERELLIYLNRFPQGRHAREARQRLNQSFESSTPAVALARPETIEELLAREARDRERRRADDEAARMIETNRSIDEIVRWGEHDTERRPAEPVVNANGIALGDRYRWRIFDRGRGDFRPFQMFRRIDRVLTDGTLRGQDDALEFDAHGQVVHDVDQRNKNWTDWTLPLPTAEVAAGTKGPKLDIETTLRTGTRSGTTMSVSFSASIARGDTEIVEVPAGRFQARRVEVTLRGRAEFTDGRRPVLYWRHTYWYAPGVALPVAWQTEERSDGLLDQRLRYELTAYDVRGGAPTLAAEGRR